MSPGYRVLTVTAVRRRPLHEVGDGGRSSGLLTGQHVADLVEGLPDELRLPPDAERVLPPTR